MGSAGSIATVIVVLTLFAGVFALLLVTARRALGRRSRAAVERAIIEERLRLARDLHDGLAQDLAFIAAHGERLADELGAEHPVAIAARRVLTATRGEILDLAAADAPTAATALARVAGELADRHDLHVTVDAPEIVLSAAKREELVRIAREAIANAVRHGRACAVAVSLRMRGDELVMEIDDDGTGVESGQTGGSGLGFGLPTMRARAQQLGGRLVVGPGRRGGTRIEVLV
jgi:signal transduction histidine kinase